MKTIEIYGQKGCSFCTRALLFCRENNYRHVYRDIADPQNKQEMFRRFPKAKTVPQIFVGEIHIGGFDGLAALPSAQIQQMIGE